MSTAPADRDDRLEVWFTLMRAHAAVAEALEQDLQEADRLPLSWYEVLLGISHDPSGRMRMQELATFALLSKSGLSRLVDRMEAGGLVRRESCSNDRRGTWATLTAQGKKALEGATPVVLEGFDRSVARHLSDTDVRSLKAALGKILEAHGQPASLECRPPSEMSPAEPGASAKEVLAGSASTAPSGRH